MLIDKYNRRLNYLRVSVTDRCNLSCVYCVSPIHAIKKLPPEEVLRYEEILRIVRIGTSMGINKIRVTGGEPLVRKGLPEFLNELAGIKTLSDISLTTNGILLERYLEDILKAGVRRINISLDTLNRRKYESISGRDGFSRVWRAIEAAHEAGMNPIKLNVVAMKNINDDELADIAALSFKLPFHIRFIEYMPISSHSSAPELFLPYSEIMNRIKTLGEPVPVAAEIHDGPAVRYKFKGAAGEIGFIRPVSHHFCDRCNRLRLTAGGYLRSCLLSNDQIDLKTLIRNGENDDKLKSAVLESVQMKPHRHTLGVIPDYRAPAEMSCIGG